MNRWASALIVAAAILMTASPALAGSPPLLAMETTPGGSLRPPGDSTVGVVRQHLLLDLREYEGRIRATYRLRNLSDKAIDQSIAFPVPPWVLGEWKVGVTLDNRPYPVRLALGPVVTNDGEVDLHKHWRDPFTGAVYFPKKINEPVGPQYLIFGVAFNPGQERELSLEYWQFPGEDYGPFVKPVRRFDFLLQPARHWAEFGELTIEVQVPPGVHMNTMLPMEPKGPGRYEAYYEWLPEGNLSIFVAPGKGPRWWWDRAGRTWFLTWLAAGSGLAAGGLALAPWLRARRLSLGLSLVAWATLYLLAPSNLLRADPTGTLFLWVLFIPALMVLHILSRSLVLWSVRTWRNRHERAGV